MDQCVCGLGKGQGLLDLKLAKGPTSPKAKYCVHAWWLWERGVCRQARSGATAELDVPPMRRWAQSAPRQLLQATQVVTTQAVTHNVEWREPRGHDWQGAERGRDTWSVRVGPNSKVRSRHVCDGAFVSDIFHLMQRVRQVHNTLKWCYCPSQDTNILVQTLTLSNFAQNTKVHYQFFLAQNYLPIVNAIILMSQSIKNHQ